ncbi:MULTISPECIES: hypothetical protein [unclassified Chryseobacterium]|uniref:hypothetical protein n=1 Tax=unclassified Chryseobacterium TaxID=2593645 RepID=UPI00226A791C|nr:MULTISPECIES: hypothetical protein [unclassified Chryseobacterium]
MKKFLNIGFSTVILGVIFISCNDDDENYQTIKAVEKIKIDSVNITQDTMQVLGVQAIKTFSTYTSMCEGFYGYDYVSGENLTRTVTSYKYITDGVCSTTNHAASGQINFSPQEAGTYTFKFWTGGDTWLTKTIIVKP